MRFDSKFALEAHVVRSIVSSVSKRIGILRSASIVFDGTSLSLRCYYSFVFPTLAYCYHALGSAAGSHRQLVELQVRSVARLCLDQILAPLDLQHLMAGDCMLPKVCYNSMDCLY